ncbi:uncharacterized protein EMH_0023270 [Eimeria mitis]|uniref:Uncharacterized protein n=1 Tax=Eimeria mitis TaxID=44415 RepID=U6KMP4_9EIME|nr:uncharacterized protein EMH_0023270 [Eimeria mitis]CDJ36723.1 hypothetical protein, conserved [Eimeria mitis]
MPALEDQRDELTVTSSTLIPKMNVNETPDQVGYLGNSPLSASSDTDAGQYGKEKPALGKPTGKPLRVLWAALATTLSLAAVAFLVRQCFTGMQNATVRRLAEEPESPEAESESCFPMVQTPVERVIRRVEGWLILSPDEYLAFKVDYFVATANVEVQGEGPRTPERLRELQVMRIVSIPEAALSASITLTIRAAQGRELEIDPPFVHKWAANFLKHSREKRAKILMGSVMFKIKYKEHEVAAKFTSLWNAAETLILTSAFCGKDADWKVSVKEGRKEASAVLKMRCLNERERRKLSGAPGLDVTASRSWKPAGDGDEDEDVFSEGSPTGTLYPTWRSSQRSIASSAYTSATSVSQVSDTRASMLVYLPVHQLYRQQ